MRRSIPPALLSSLLVVAAGLAAYANSFSVPFQFDDTVTVVDHPAVQSLPAFFAARWVPQRWVTLLTFALNGSLWGPHPAGYHAVNLAIHLAAALLLLRLVGLVARTEPLRGSVVERHAGAIAATAALLFVAHPLQTQAVTYVSQRFASLAAALFLLSVVAYLEARLATGRAAAARWYAAFLVATVAALLAKESAFTLPLVLAAAELLFFSAPLRQRLAWLSPLLAAGAALFLALGIALLSGTLTFARLDAVTRIDPTLSRSTYLLTQLGVVARYLGLLVAPVGQNLDHDVRLVSDLGAPSTWLALLLHLGLLLVGAVAAWRGRRGSPWLLAVAFGIVWFYSTILVESAFIPIPDLMFEHRAYLPSVGYFLAVAVLLARFPLTGGNGGRDGGWTRRKTVAVALATALLVGLTVARNRVWQDDLALWTDAAEKSPGKARALNNVGVALSIRGRHAEAATWYERTIAADPGYSKAWFNLGETWQQLGRCDLAIPWLERFARLHPGYPEVFARLAECHDAHGDTAAAAADRERAERLRGGGTLPLFYR